MLWELIWHCYHLPGSVLCSVLMQFAESLSEEAIAAFPPTLPALDDSQISPAIALAAAKLQKDYTSAASSARNVMRTLRDAWASWHHLPTKHAGQAVARYRVAMPRRAFKISFAQIIEYYSVNSSLSYISINPVFNVIVPLSRLTFGSSCASIL